MITEDDFQNHLDQHPDDHQTRMVLADFLQENNDPRANGYRALGKLRKHALDESPNWGHQYTHDQNNTKYLNGEEMYKDHQIPKDWLDITPKVHLRDNSYWRVEDSRKALEDRLAHSFNKLPPERQHELLGLDTPQIMSRKLTSRRKSYKRHG